MSTPGEGLSLGRRGEVLGGRLVGMGREWLLSESLASSASLMHSVRVGGQEGQGYGLRGIGELAKEVLLV
jgi:hypothetical protein